MESPDQSHTPHSDVPSELPVHQQAGDGLVEESPRRAPWVYRCCDGVTEAGLYFMVVFGPWAFGTTEDWSVSLMNLAGYGLGLLLLSKWLIRGLTGYRPARWGDLPPGNFSKNQQLHARLSRCLTWLLAILTILILGLCFASAWNARAVFHRDQLSFEYFPFRYWLPHSYDRLSTWFTFWEYLGLACSFWALRDWLLGKTEAEVSLALERGEECFLDEKAVFSVQSRSSWGSSHLSRLPTRLHRLLWVLCCNGILLAVEGFAQRLSGTSKLLWLVEPHIHKEAETQFGPYAYRSNGSQYLNLVWPLCAGFAWLLARGVHRAKRLGLRRLSRGYIFLALGAIVMAACPIISTTRGGAVVAAGQMLGVLVILTMGSRGMALRHWAGLALLFLISVQLAIYFGWEQLKPRLQEPLTTQLVGREEIYKNARKMLEDAPWFGTGPGTFANLYQMYRDDNDQFWAAQAHDDWLETRITFGWIGFGLILAALGVAGLNWFVGGGMKLPVTLTAVIGVAMAGCLFHAHYDFPFQVHSLLALFLMQSCILSCAAKP